MVKHDVKDMKLAPAGKKEIDWAERDMPVLRLIRKEFAAKKPLKGMKLAACLHVTKETANLMLALKAGGAEVGLCASNPLSTQDSVAASLVVQGVPVFAINGENNKQYYQHIEAALLAKPNVTMDDGADVISTLHGKRRDLLAGIMGGTEETTTGVIRLRSLEEQGKLEFPVVAVNDADTKHFFDNRYGTGQSTMDGVLRATNKLIAGSAVVICGYGWCGRGLAIRAAGMGARVIIIEVDPLKALEAHMDGYQVMPIAKAAPLGDVFITVTGDISVIRKEHFAKMKDGAIVCNSGHFNVELDLEDLAKMCKTKRKAKPFVDEFVLKNGRSIFVLGEGRLVNLAAAEGHPASVMDMSFANQALAAQYIFKNAERLEKKVYRVPEDIDKRISRLKLKAEGVSIDTLTPKQKKYLASWEMGT